MFDVGFHEKTLYSLLSVSHCGEKVSPPLFPGYPGSGNNQ